MSSSVAPSASRRMVRTAAAVWVISALRSTAVAARGVGAGRASCVRTSAPALTAGLEDECEGRADAGRAAGERGVLGRDRLLRDDRVAPVVEADVLGEQLRAQAVRVAGDGVE